MIILNKRACLTGGGGLLEETRFLKVCNVNKLIYSSLIHLIVTQSNLCLLFNFCFLGM